MPIHAPSTRRDPRLLLRPGAGVVVLPRAVGRSTPLSATLTKISAAGVAFLLEEQSPAPASGSVISNVELRVGECVLRGDIAIRDVRALGDSTIEVGGMFLPENREVEVRLMALLAGIGAALAD